MRAKVIAPTLINSKPFAVGAVVDVDENTFRNLAKKGRLEAADSTAKEVDLTIPSTLSVEEAEAREAKAKKEAAAKAAKK